jgi:hypothetical protein
MITFRKTTIYWPMLLLPCRKQFYLDTETDSTTLMTQHKKHTTLSLAAQRAVIKNAFGMLKLKFQSLQNLPIQVNHLRNMDKVASWIMAYVVLHNFVRLHVRGELFDRAGLRRLTADQAEQQAARDARAQRAGHVVVPDPGAEINGARQGGRKGTQAKAKRDAIIEYC